MSPFSIIFHFTNFFGSIWELILLGGFSNRNSIFISSSWINHFLLFNSIPVCIVCLATLGLSLSNISIFIEIIPKLSVQISTPFTCQHRPKELIWFIDLVPSVSPEVVKDIMSFDWCPFVRWPIIIAVSFRFWRKSVVSLIDFIKSLSGIWTFIIFWMVLES